MAQPGDVLVQRALGGKPRRHALEPGPDHDELDDLALRLAHDEDAAPGRRAHEALPLEKRERLANRRAADAEVLAELALVEPDLVRMAVDVHLRDRFLDGVIR